ncbi:D-glycero-beta-D-manno-heptose-7-phosphate kinase [Rhizobium sp. HT1-10]|uniref:D-glycero-beta-D-manno-heptose-7-phosphate kinase n=1 Tax=Rhizobium sp. HT1-10 TaxID=3111638 RepID=UPI003C25DFBA
MWDMVQKFASAKVAVIGDLMLDIYIQGEVSRVSPEAPVPIVKRVSERTVPGGAANVAANIAALGATVHLVGVANRDNGFVRLTESLNQFGGVDLSGVVMDESRSTITKTRVLGRHQQIVRVDSEDNSPFAAAIEDALIEAAKIAIDTCDLVIHSDYGKGVLSDRVLEATMAHARSAGKLVLVDPKRRDFSAYRGASIITPNRAELTEATGLACESDDEAEAAARLASKTCGADVLLTRSERGMSYFGSDNPPMHLATVAREVFDVSGAGDTVVAVLGVTLASGLSIIEAMRAANHAAGLVVAKVGTATISPQELLLAMQDSEGSRDIQDGRLLDIDELLATRAFWRDSGLKVGFANGCFDLIHPGHISLIRQAASNCDRLVMALNTDASVRRLKGPSRPVQTEDARADVMGALKDVAAVVLFDEDTPYDLIAALLPDLLVKGADYTEDQVVGASVVRDAGGAVLLADLTQGQSTSRLIGRSKTPVTGNTQ